MHASSPTATAAPVQLSRSRLAALLALVVGIAAALTGAVFAFSGGGASTPVAKPALSPQVRAAVDNVPLIPAVAARPVTAEARHVQEIVSLTPLQRLEAFGTDFEAAAALAPLGPRERLQVESIIALTPTQLRAAFGTGR